MIRQTISAMILIFLSTVDAATFVCSSQNTSTRARVYAMFQSQGLCSGTCAGYAFAILQGFDCYCSNFSPSVTVSASQCNTRCPGFGTDNCGGINNGAFAYYQLAQASGTLSLSSATTSPATTSSATTPSTTTTSVRSAGAVTNAGNVAIASPSSSSTSSTTTPQSVVPVTQTITQTASAVPTSTSTSSTSVSSTAPISSTSRVIIANTMQTSLTSSTASSPATTTRAQSSGLTELQTAGSSNSFFDSAGKVAGTFVAVGLVLLALLGALLFFCCRKRRENRSQSSLSAAALNRKPSPSSTLDGLTQGDAGRNRSGSTSRLMGYGLFAAGGPTPGREKDVESGAAINWPRPHEGSDILPIDQRLNPRPMLMRFDSNYSRSSLRDDQDYSRRVLTVANPDD